VKKISKRFLGLLLSVTMLVNVQIVPAMADELPKSVESTGSAKEIMTEEISTETSSEEIADEETIAESSAEQEPIEETDKQADTESEQADREDIQISENDEEAESEIEAADDEEGTLEESMTAEEWAAGFDGGTGTGSNPYLISSRTTLKFFNEHIQDYNYAGNNYYKLTRSIDYGENEWIPITKPNSITSFDGNGCTISNIKIVKDDRSGSGSEIFMFSRVKNLKDLTIDNVEFVDGRGTAASTLTAAVFENRTSSDNLTNCILKGTIKLSSSITKFGGFMIYNAGDIQNCKFRATVDANCDLAGIAITNYGGIRSCTNEGTLKSTADVAGIVINNSRAIDSCSNEGALTGKNVYGIAVESTQSIADCTNHADLTAESVVCGITGQSGTLLTNCGNLGNLQGKYAYGIASGIYQYAQSTTTIENCKNFGRITALDKAAGVLGELNTNSGRGYPVILRKCGNEGDVLSTGGTVAGVVANVSVKQQIGNVKIEKCYNAGSVIMKDSRYWVGGIAGTATGGVTFFECYNEGTIIGIGTFAGIVGEMNSHYSVAVAPVVSGCYNLGEITIDLEKGRGDCKVGGIAGDVSAGMIENSYNAGNVTGMSYVGGIVGSSQNYNGVITVINCYNRGKVTSLYDKWGIESGGIIGRTQQYDGYDYRICNCYNMGEILNPNVSNYRVGQLFGYLGEQNEGMLDISGCYYSKDLGDYASSDNYLDPNEADRLEAGIHGVTTAQMKKAETFSEYDFIEIWSMGDADYPYPILSIIGAGDGFKISYVLGGGKNNPNNAKSFTQEDTVTLYAPTRTGYEFQGWYEDSAYTTPITTIDGAIRRNITVYAKWLLGMEELDPVSVNGSGYGHLRGVLKDDQGKVLKDRGFNWALYDITDGTEVEVASGGSVSSEKDGSFSVATDRLRNTDAKKTVTKRYRIKMTILEEGVIKELHHVIESDVKVTPFAFTQSWDMGADVSGKFTAGPSAPIKVGEASLEGSFLEFGAGGGFGRHISVSQEHKDGKQNLTLSESYAAKLGGSFSFGPKLSLKISDTKKYGLPSFGVGAGVTAGTTINPGLVINDYDVKDNADADKLGAFLLNSTALSSGNLVLLGMSAAATKDVNYINQLGDSQTVVVEGNGNVGMKFEKLGGIGTTISGSEKKTYTYSTSDRLDWNLHSVTSTFKTDRSLGLDNGGKTTLSSGADLKLGNGFNVGAGNAFAVTAGNTYNGILGDDTLTFTASDSDTSAVSFIVGSSETKTQKMGISYEGDQMQKLLIDVEPLRRIAYDNSKFLFDTTHQEIYEGIIASDAVGTYKRSDVDQWGKSVTLGLGVPGISVSGSLAGTYSESYVAESGTYTEGTAFVESESDGSLLTGTSYTDVVSLLNDPLENYYYRALKLIGDVKTTVENGGRKVVEYFEAKLSVASQGIASGADYVVHIFTPNTDQSSRNMESFEVCTLEADAPNVTAYKPEMVRTVGEPYLIYLTEATESAEEDGAIMDDFPEGDSVTLTLGYTAESLAAAGINDVNDGNINVYQYNDAYEAYECIGGTRDLENKTVSVEIAHPGQYILGVDDDIPIIRYVDVSDITDCPTITVQVDELGGFGQVRIAVDDKELINTSNYRTYYNKSNKTFTYSFTTKNRLSDGEHTLSVFLTDDAGNGMQTPLEFTFYTKWRGLMADAAECATENGSVRVRGKLNIYSDYEVSLVDSVWAIVTELHTPEGGDPIAVETTVNMECPIAGGNGYTTGIANKQYADSTITKYAIVVRDVYGKETRTEFDCTGEAGIAVGRVEDGESTDLWYYMPYDTVIYTGVGRKPELYIFEGTKLLTEKKDYTVSYSNNVKANLDSNWDPKPVPRPAITVTGKGNYTLKDTIFFDIEPCGLYEGEDIVGDIPTHIYDGKVYKPVPEVIANLRKPIKLSPKKDYTVSYYKALNEGMYNYAYGEEVEPREVGYYIAVIETPTDGNFDGRFLIKFQIAEPERRLISKCSFSKISNKPYTGSPMKPNPGELIIKDGRTKVLTEGVDYRIDYIWSDDAYIDVGTMNLVIYGIGNYVGKKTVTYQITGTPISKAVVSSAQMKNSPFYYDETAHELTDLVLTYKASKTDSGRTLQGISAEAYENLSDDELAERTYDYTYRYLNNVEAGTATLELTGINGFYGTVKKTFKINRYTVQAGSKEKYFKAELPDSSYAYEYPAVLPKPLVYFAGKPLTENKDYKLVYANNKAVNDGSNLRKKPTVTVVPMGNFAGASSVFYFVITPGNMENMRLDVQDKVYGEKKGAWKSAVTLYSMEGKKVGASGNYNNKVVYRYETFANPDSESIVVKNIANAKSPTWEFRRVGDLVDDADIVPTGTVIRAVVAGIGNFKDASISNTYRIVQKNIASLSVSVRTSKDYTGSAVTLRKDELKFMSGRTELQDVTFEIDEASYTNNINKGKASVTIRGVGNYGGTKVVTYSIAAKKLSWRQWMKDWFYYTPDWLFY